MSTPTRHRDGYDPEPFDDAPTLAECERDEHDLRRPLDPRWRP